MKDPGIIATIHAVKGSFIESNDKPIDYNLYKHISLHSIRLTSEQLKSHPPISKKDCHQITFETIPKSNLGIVCGCSNDCDVVLPPNEGVANYHGVFTFDENQRLIYRDLGSLSGSKVDYTDIGEYCNTESLWRRDFHWIIGGHKFLKNEQITTIELGRSFKIEIVVNQNNFSGLAFEEYITRFRNGIEDHRLRYVLGRQNQVDETILKTHIIGTGPMTIERGLDSGAHGHVRHSWDVSTGDEYAIKRPSGDSNAVTLANEASILKKLSHPHIVKLHRAEFEPDTCLYFEYVPCLDLSKYEHFNHREALGILAQCIAALDHLHGLGIVLRDIKPSNILVEDRGPNYFLVKLADFGLAQQGGILVSPCGSLDYLAPEIPYRDDIQPEEFKEYTSKVDIWSLGATIYSLIYELRENDDHEHYCQLLAEEMRRKHKKNPCRLNSILSRMLVKDPAQRVSARDCYDLVFAALLEDSSCCSSEKDKPKRKSHKDRSFGLDEVKETSSPPSKAGDAKVMGKDPVDEFPINGRDFLEEWIETSAATEMHGMKRAKESTQSISRKRQDIKLSVHALTGAISTTKSNIAQNEDPLERVYHPDKAFGGESQETFKLEKHHFKLSKTSLSCVSSRYYTPEPEEMTDYGESASPVVAGEHLKYNAHDPEPNLRLSQGFDLIEQYLLP
ncbi:kinase-like domain-containing protein [Camillea tinctor]|nr:kinase-like domain-containing protein [Camillea tinctor]